MKNKNHFCKIISSIFLIFIFGILFSKNISAQSVDEINKRIEERKDIIKKLEAEAEKYKKEIEKTWKEIMQENHPVLIIATGSFLLLPRSDIGTIIIEKENSRSYKMQTRPFLDIRTVAETIAKKSGTKLLLGDIILRTETLWKEKEGIYALLSPLKFRALTTAKCEIVSMRIPKDMQKKNLQ